MASEVNRSGYLDIRGKSHLSCSDVIPPESTLHLWDEVEDFYMMGDIVCANLESPVDPSKPAKKLPAVCLTAPALNTTPEMFERYARGGSGINFFSTANNHSLDQGEDGLLATLEFFDSTGCKHVGTSRTSGEQLDIPVIEKNGIRVAFISYTYCLNSFDPIPGKEYMTNMIRLNKPGTDISLIEEHVAAAHRKKADVTMKQLENGINPYGFIMEEEMELKRLERLLYDKLLPAKHAALLA